MRFHNPYGCLVGRSLSVCRVADAIGKVVVMYIPQDEVEYIRFILIVDGLMAGLSVGVLVFYGVICFVEWIRRLINGR